MSEIISHQTVAVMQLELHNELTSSYTELQHMKFKFWHMQPQQRSARNYLFIYHTLFLIIVIEFNHHG
jgi:hypothetical protein